MRCAEILVKYGISGYKVANSNVFYLNKLIKKSKRKYNKVQLCETTIIKQ